MNNTEEYERLNPFTKIWTQPRAVVRQVIEEKSTGFILLMIVLAGFAVGLISTMGSEQAFPILGILLGAVIIGPFGLVISIAVGAGIFFLLGKLFKGKSTYSEMFLAVLTGQIPQIWLIPVVVLWMILFPEDYFLQPEEMMPSVQEPLALVFLVILAVVSIWNFVIQCKAIGEAHQFSAWKAFIIIFIPSVLTVFIIAALFILFFMVLLPAVAGT